MRPTPNAAAASSGVRYFFLLTRCRSYPTHGTCFAQRAFISKGASMARGDRMDRDHDMDEMDDERTDRSEGEDVRGIAGEEDEEFDEDEEDLEDLEEDEEEGIR